MSSTKETKAFESVITDLDMSVGERAEFQDYLAEYYPDMRYSNNYNELVEVAHEYLSR